MSELKPILESHPIRNLNAVIKSVKSDIAPKLALSKGKKRHSKEKLIEHILALDKMGLLKERPAMYEKPVRAKKVKAEPKAAPKKKEEPKKAQAPSSAKIKKEIKSILNKHYGEIAKLEQKVLDGKITEINYDGELDEKLDDDLYELKEKYNIKNFKNDTEFFENMKGTNKKYINVLKEKSFGGFKSIPNYVKANKIGDKIMEKEKKKTAPKKKKIIIMAKKSQIVKETPGSIEAKRIKKKLEKEKVKGKKPRSEKQKANDKRLGEAAKARAVAKNK